jgi:hypothetical protein
LLRCAPRAGLIIKLAANVAETWPYAELLFGPEVKSATYAKTTENVTENKPDRAIMMKNHLIDKVV